MAIGVLAIAGCSFGDDGEEVDRTPSGEGVALAAPGQRTSGAPTTVTDGSGAITFEVPDGWSSTEQWASDKFVTGVLASTDTKAYIEDVSWAVPAVGVTVSRSLAEGLSGAPDVAELSRLLDQVLARSLVADACEDRRSSTITEGGSDALSLSIGRYFDFGVADTFTGCGDEQATFTDLVAASAAQRVIVYMQLQVPAPEHQPAVDRALQTLTFDLSKLEGGDTEGATTAPAVEKQAITGPVDETALRQLVPSSLGGASHSEVVTSRGGGAGAVVGVAADYYVPGRRALFSLDAYESPEAANAVLEQEDQYPGEAFETTAAQEGTVTAGGQTVGKWRLFNSPGSTFWWPGAMVIWTNGSVFARLLIYDVSGQDSEQAREDEALALFREAPI